MDRLTRYSAEEFKNEVRPKLFGFSEKAINLIELFFVQGVALTSAGDQCGMSKQSANQTINRTVAVLNGYPKDWVHFEGFMPPSEAAALRKKLKFLMSGE